MSERETIHVVLDPHGGDQLTEIAARGHVWITPSETNEKAVEEYWKTAGDGSNTVTIWGEPRTGATEEEWLSILDDIELHHSEDWAGPGIAGLEVYGAPLTEQARLALEQFGYEAFEASGNSFRASRAG
jgi:hypothetical protein